MSVVCNVLDSGERILAKKKARKELIIVGVISVYHRLCKDGNLLLVIV